MCSRYKYRDFAKRRLIFTDIEPDTLPAPEPPLPKKPCILQPVNDNVHELGIIQQSTAENLLPVASDQIPVPKSVPEPEPKKSHVMKPDNGKGRVVLHEIDAKKKIAIPVADARQPLPYKSRILKKANDNGGFVLQENIPKKKNPNFVPDARQPLPYKSRIVKPAIANDGLVFQEANAKNPIPVPNARQPRSYKSHYFKAANTNGPAALREFSSSSKDSLPVAVARHHKKDDEDRRYIRGLILARQKKENDLYQKQMEPHKRDFQRHGKPESPTEKPKSFFEKLLGWDWTKPNQSTNPASRPMAKFADMDDSNKENVPSFGQTPVFITPDSKVKISPDPAIEMDSGFDDDLDVLDIGIGGADIFMIAEKEYKRTGKLPSMAELFALQGEL